MAASFSSQLSLLLAQDRSSSSGYTSSSSSGLSAPTCLDMKSRSGLASSSRLSSRGSGAIVVAPKVSAPGRRLQQIVGARRPGKSRDGALAQAEEEVKIPGNSEPDDMWMGKKLEGLEPDFWEGEQWDVFGFIVQYMWAIGVVVALGACGVAVVSYNSGAVDIRETDVFKEALENQVEADASFDSESFQDFPEPSVAPPLE